MASNVIRIETPGPPSIVQAMAGLVTEASAFQVSNVEENKEALERIKSLRKAVETVKDWFEPARKHADRAKKEILALRDGFIMPMVEARRLYDVTADAFEQVERARAEKQRRELAEAARKAEEEIQIQDAIDAAAMGEPEQADAIMDEKPEPVAISVAPQVAKVSGVSSRLMWSAEIHDFKSLVRYVADHPEWESLLERDRLVESHPNLNRLAVSQQKALAIPGVRAVSKRSRR